MNPLFMQIWIEAFKVEYRLAREHEGASPAEAGFQAAQKAEAACAAAQRAAAEAKAAADTVVRL